MSMDHWSWSLTDQASVSHFSFGQLDKDSNEKGSSPLKEPVKERATSANGSRELTFWDKLRALESEGKDYSKDFDWIMSDKTKDKYDQFYQSLKLKYNCNKLGLTFQLCKKLIGINNKLSEPDLFHLWNLVDLDNNHFLDTDEFAIMGHILVNIVDRGQKLPSALPLKMIPPQRRHLYQAKYHQDGNRFVSFPDYHDHDNKNFLSPNRGVKTVIHPLPSKQASIIVPLHIKQEIFPNSPTLGKYERIYDVIISCRPLSGFSKNKFGAKSYQIKIRGKPAQVQECVQFLKDEIEEIRNYFSNRKNNDIINDDSDNEMKGNENENDIETDNDETDEIGNGETDISVQTNILAVKSFTKLYDWCTNNVVMIKHSLNKNLGIAENNESQINFNCEDNEYCIWNCLLNKNDNTFQLQNLKSLKYLRFKLTDYTFDANGNSSDVNTCLMVERKSDHGEEVRVRTKNNYKHFDNKPAYISILNGFFYDSRLKFYTRCVNNDNNNDNNNNNNNNNNDEDVMNAE